MTVFHLANSPSFRTPRQRTLLPSFAIALALLDGAGAAGQPPVAARDTVYGRSAAETTATEQGGQAERVVSAALAGLSRADSISARVRQRVRIGDRVLVGAGRYLQLGTGIDQRFRYELSM